MHIVLSSGWRFALRSLHFLTLLMQIIPLSEGSFTIDKTKLFVPFDDSEHELTDRPTGSLLVEIQPFVIRTSKDVLLLDTGLGFNDSAHGKMQLHYNLEKAG